MTFAIHKSNNRLTPESKEILLEQIRGLKDGTHYVSISQIDVHTGRYKYYWHCLLPFIYAQIPPIPHPIENRPITLEELHEVCKNTFNEQPTVANDKGLIFGGSSTRKLSDKAFYQYEERIIQYFAERYVIQFVDREDYPAWAKNQKRILKSNDNDN